LGGVRAGAGSRPGSDGNLGDHTRHAPAKRPRGSRPTAAADWRAKRAPRLATTGGPHTFPLPAPTPTWPARQPHDVEYHDE